MFNTFEAPDDVPAREAYMEERFDVPEGNRFPACPECKRPVDNGGSCMNECWYVEEIYG